MSRVNAPAIAIGLAALALAPLSTAKGQATTPSTRPPRATVAPAQRSNAPTPPPQGSAAEVVAHSTNLSSRSAKVQFDLANGDEVAITLSRGTLYRDGDKVGTYPRDGAMERAWRALLSHAGDLTTPQLVYAIHKLPTEGLSPEARQEWNDMIAVLPVPGAKALGEPPDLKALFEAPADQSGAMARGIGGGIAGGIASGLDAEALRSAIEAAQGINVDSIRDAASAIAREAMDQRLRAEGMRVRTEPSAGFSAGQVATDVAGLFGTLVALASLGFGAVFFVPQRLELVADTVRRSPIRAFLTGLCAQPLLLPALVTLIIGMILTVVGILVVPVAIIAFVLAVIGAAVGGYLAVARVVGELYIRRRGQQGAYTSGWTTYRYLVYGLIGLLVIWAPVALMRWIPVAGTILLFTAALFTWMMVTTGFGAAILSRGGTGWTFARSQPREVPSQTFWSETAPVPAAGAERRPRA